MDAIGFHSYLDTEVLDKLVLEYLDLQEGIPSAQSQVLDGSRKIEQLVLQGDIPEAIDATGRLAPEVLKGRRLLFKLKRQQFLQYAQLEGPATEYAIKFLRTELAPLAMELDPAAYSELKACLLALILHKVPSYGLRSFLCPDLRKPFLADLAAELGRAVRQSCGCTDSRLSLLLRYMIVKKDIQGLSKEAAKEFEKQTRVELASLSTKQLVEGLRVRLSERAVTPLLSQELPLEARTALASISERDKLFVEDCFHLSTEEVTKCLEAARGDLVLALKFEVSAVPFSQAFLDKLVWEYADSRGMKRSGREACNCAEGDEDVLMEEQRLSPAHNCLAEQDCRWGVSKGPRSRDSSRSPPKKLARLCSEVKAKSPEAKSDALDVAAASGIISRIQADVEAGRLAEAISAVEKLDRRFADLKEESFLESHPHLHFEIQAARFQQLLDSGDPNGAVALARTKLATISKCNKLLPPQLKAVLARLIPEEPCGPQLSLAELACVVAYQLRQWLGLQEPALVRLLKAMLAVEQSVAPLPHALQPFERELGMERLQKQTLAPHFAKPSSGQESLAPVYTPLSPVSTVEYDELPVEFDNEVVTKAMEVTQLGRDAVVTLLRDVDGDLEMLLNQLFQ